MVNLVFSYSHVDEDLRNKLEVHLAGLKHLGLIDTWHDRRIVAGTEFAQEINRSFREANIYLLLISPDFIASDYCYNVEMQQALQRHEKKEAIVIPIILRPCDWHDLPFGKLLAGTLDGKPIVHFPTVDDGFLQVVQAIKKAISSLPKKNEVKDSESEFATNPQASIEATPTYRSSNLRIKKTFTDRDRDRARVEGFEYVAGYYENSLEELKQRNPGVDTEFRRVDANSFEAAIYVEGKRKCRCGIWIGNAYQGGDIFFSNSGITKGSYNESMSLNDDGFSLGFKPLGMSFHSQESKLLSNEGMAEQFWENFIGSLQQ